LTPSLFKKVVIANRGEVALRVIRSCKKLGIKSVAVYSDADVDSRHVRLADEAYRIGPAPPHESYLNQDRILSVASRCGAEAIHPGYGFLAENAEFARACEERDLAFIGPSSASIERLGNKLEAKRIMAKAGVQVIPASQEALGSEHEAAAESRDLGFPVLIKAVYGGGGRGLRVARNVKEVRRFFGVTRAEAGSAFAMPEIYVEKYIEKARHVEIQVLADRRGRIVHLGERECSIQRRHQKLLEEAPSPALDAKLRERLTASATNGLRAASYENAGTVEFLLDSNRRYYFLEVNKRLQVEHLVTEMTTGVDMVEQQIRIASGEPLAFSQNNIHVNGWAMNCRINAEDPTRNFSPSPGKVISYNPPGGPGIRVDSALYSGYTIPEYYDSLIAKVAAWGRDRLEAISRLSTALDEITLEGIPTTIPAHKAILQDRAFRLGRMHTQFVEDHMTKIENAILMRYEVAALSAAIVDALGFVRMTHVITPHRIGAEKTRWIVNARREAIEARQHGGPRHFEAI